MIISFSILLYCALRNVDRKSTPAEERKRSFLVSHMFKPLQIRNRGRMQNPGNQRVTNPHEARRETAQEVSLRSWNIIDSKPFANDSLFQGPTRTNKMPNALCRCLILDRVTLTGPGISHLCPPLVKPF